MNHPSPSQEDDEMQTRTKLDAVEDARRRLQYIHDRLDMLYSVNWDNPPPPEELRRRANETDYLEGRKRALVGWLAGRAGGGDA